MGLNGRLNSCSLEWMYKYPAEEEDQYYEEKNNYYCNSYGSDSSSITTYENLDQLLINIIRFIRRKEYYTIVDAIGLACR